LSSFQQDCIKPTPEGLRPDVDIVKWVWIVPGVALLIAVLPLPYVYYALLRVLIAGFAAYFVWKEYEGNAKTVNSFVWIFGAIAVLFNPFFPIHLAKAIWAVVNIATAVYFLWHLRMRRNNTN
jgi:hypothetical protein